MRFPDSNQWLQAGSKPSMISYVLELILIIDNIAIDKDLVVYDMFAGKQAISKGFGFGPRKTA